MLQFVTPSRKLIMASPISARRTRFYRPGCTPLEDRCLLSVSLSGVSPSPGRIAVLDRNSQQYGQAPVYQFRVGPTGGPSTWFVTSAQQHLPLEPHPGGDLISR
ncbi:MAG: hypothetical protein WKF75_16115 [Singulisphaera sp.]